MRRPRLRLRRLCLTLERAMGAVTAPFEEQIRRMTPVAAPLEQRAAVEALFRAMDTMAHAPKHKAPKCKLVGPKGEALAIPESVFYVLERVAEVMARGDSVTVVPVGRELTTQQAADLLQVSRQYLVRLLDEKRIPFAKTGKHRRLRIEDVLSFKQTRDRDRRAGMRSLTRLTEELGGYESELK
jgi:excisionase family DNA binding protein